MKTLTTIENYKLKDLCTTGGLQDIYNIAFAEASSLVVDVETSQGKKALRSAAAKVSSSKVLFVDACKDYIKQEEAHIVAGKNEIKAFIKSMDELRDKTKQPAIDAEARERAILDAKNKAIALAEEEEKAAKKAEYEALAMENAHLEALIENMKFDIDAKNAVVEQKNVDSSTPQPLSNPIESLASKIFEVYKEPMDSSFKLDSTSDDAISFQKMAAAEDLIGYVGIDLETANLIISTIVDGKIGNVEWVES